MQEPLLARVFRFVAALAAVFVITFFYHKILPVNATTVALTLVLAILAVSTAWGIAVAVFMSVVAMLAFNFYFLPPVGTLTIADPQNWVALFVFLAVSVMASQLASRARRRTVEASSRRREVEKLYAFSQVLLETGNVIELLNRIPSRIVD